MTGEAVSNTKAARSCVSGRRAVRVVNYFKAVSEKDPNCMWDIIYVLTDGNQYCN